MVSCCLPTRVILAPQHGAADETGPAGSSGSPARVLAGPLHHALAHSLRALRGALRGALLRALRGSSTQPARSKASRTRTQPDRAEGTCAVSEPADNPLVGTVTRDVLGPGGSAGTAIRHGLLRLCELLLLDELLLLSSLLLLLPQEPFVLCYRRDRRRCGAWRSRSSAGASIHRIERGRLRGSGERRGRKLRQRGLPEGR